MDGVFAIWCSLYAIKCPVYAMQIVVRMECVLFYLTLKMSMYHI